MLAPIAILPALLTSAFTTPDIPLSKQEVSFMSGSNRLSGTIYRPAGVAPSAKLPAVVITGAWFTIKEQMPTTYAKEFARQGYTAFVFDFTNFGDSEGKARNFESPSQKTADIIAATQFLQKLKFVDPKTLSGFAMCASAGYMSNAIVKGAPLKAFAVAAPWIQDQSAIEAVYGGKAGVEALLQVGDDAKKQFAASGKVVDVPAAGPVGSDAIMQTAPYYTDKQRGMISKWDNKFALMSWAEWLRFDSLAPAKSVKVPTLVLHSDNAALPDKAREFFGSLGGSKAIYWSTEGHMDFYDAPVAVARNVALATKHYQFFQQPGGPSDREQIESVVKTVANSVDARAWSGLRQQFLPNLEVDYSSMGGRNGKVSADVLVAEWQTFHDQFNMMRHNYSNFATSISGKKAVTKYQGIAILHRKNGDSTNMWTVAGDYITTLEKIGGTWKVSGTKFTMNWTQGKP